MSVSQLSESAQNYLKAVWVLAEWSNSPVTPTLIADRTGLKLSSVSDAIRKLTGQGLLHHAPYGAVELTDEGHTYAVAMVRRHRLIESFLVTSLGYGWEEVHDEAENLEHAVSDLMVDRIDEFLGFPTRDPHGDPIPSRTGTISMPNAVQLTAVEIGSTVVVERISDDDPALLQYFEEHGIALSVSLRVSEGAPFSDSVDIRVGDAGSSLALGRSATDALYVSVTNK